jgi:hypothetical protein
LGFPSYRELSPRPGPREGEYRLTAEEVERQRLLLASDMVYLECLERGGGPMEKKRPVGRPKGEPSIVTLCWG